MLHIRRPRADEADALAELHSRTWAQAYAGQFPESAWDDRATEQRRRMWASICSEPRPDWRTAVAELDGARVGFAHSVDGEDGIRELWFIYLLQHAHGSGAGQALLDEVLRPDEPARLWVLEENPRARAFYERNGFRLDGARKPTGFERGGDELLMTR